MYPLPQRRRIYLMRHAEVSYFDRDAAGKLVPVANAEQVALTDEGRTQAAAAAQALADVPFDAAVTSGLPRTDETAAIVLGQRDVPIEQVPDLREIRSGNPADIPRDQAPRLFVEALTRPLTAEDQFLMGEAFGAFQQRVLPAFQQILANQRWHHLLMVAHGGVNRVIMAHLLGADLRSIGHLEQDAACINIIDVDDHGYGILRLVNYTPYNPTKQGITLTTMEQYFMNYQRG